MILRKLLVLLLDGRAMSATTAARWESDAASFSLMFTFLVYVF